MSDSIAGIAAMVNEHEAILSEHKAEIVLLKNGLAQTQASLTGMSAKLSEFHGENRARAEAQDKAAREGEKKTQEAIGDLSQQLSMLANKYGWAKWAFVIGGSSFAGSLLSHFPVLHQ